MLLVMLYFIPSSLRFVSQDTPSPPPDGEPSFTASTTILVSVLDVDNRPPWFMPCKEDVVGGAVICQGAGYSGSVVLTEQEVHHMTSPAVFTVTQLVQDVPYRQQHSDKTCFFWLQSCDFVYMRIRKQIPAGRQTP